MSFVLGTRSRSKLAGVHPDLVKVVTLAITLTTVDFVVTEGLRTLERQRALLASGASRTLRSRHLSGHAVDLAPFAAGTIRWDWPLFDHLDLAMKAAASQLSLPVEWGGDWVSFKDGPHFQLPWTTYPE